MTNLNSPQVIQVCVCGVVLVCYPLAIIPAPLLSVLSTVLLAVSPLLSLLEGYALFLLVTKASRLEGFSVPGSVFQVQLHQIITEAGIVEMFILEIVALCFINVLKNIDFLRFFTARLQEEDEGMAKAALIAVSLISLAISVYLNVYHIPLPPTTKVSFISLTS